MKITHKKSVRKITEDEFLRLKDQEPFSVFRQDAKACFPGDTKIYIKEQGWVPLESVVPKINEGLFTHNLKKDFKVLTPSGSYADVNFTYYGNTKEWLEFELVNGDVIKMTPNHICIVIRNNERIKVRADEVLDTDMFLAYSE